LGAIQTQSQAASSR
jgi:hypothetical protein